MQLVVQPSNQSHEFALQRAFPQDKPARNDSSFEDYLQRAVSPETDPGAEQERIDERVADPTPTDRADGSDAAAMADASKSEQAADANQAHETESTVSHVASAADTPEQPSAATKPGSPAEKAAMTQTRESETKESMDAARDAKGNDVAAALVAAPSAKTLDAAGPVAPQAAKPVEKELSFSTRKVSESRIDIELKLSDKSAASSATTDNQKPAATAVEAEQRQSTAPLKGDAKHAAAEGRSTDAALAASVKESASRESTHNAKDVAGLENATQTAQNRTESQGEDRSEPRAIEAAGPRHLRSRDSDHSRGGNDGQSNGEQRQGVQAESLSAHASEAATEPRGGESLSVAERLAGRASVRTTTLAQTAGTLRSALNESLNAEIVRSARIVVRGTDAGEIRLNIKPEELGSVRIALNMRDGHIAGRIIVENQSVREVFEQNMSSLEKAFAESGLATGGIEVTVADAGGQQDAGGNERQTAGNRGVQQFEEAVPLVEMYEERHELVDVMA